MKNLVVRMIKAYQRAPLSSHKACKYYPTCSQYMIDALEYHGLIKGLLLGIWRILRCNPFSKGGYDPVKK